MPDPRFQTTKWSMVIAASSSADADKQAQALNELCRAYWFPVLAFIRREGASLHDAEDLTQGFFAHVLNRDFFQKAHPERGYFRGFVKGALRFYLANERERMGRDKRGGRATIVPIDLPSAESWLRDLPGSQYDPAVCYDRAWAMLTLERAMSRLGAEQEAAGHLPQFIKLKSFIRETPAPGEYAKIADELGVPKGTLTVTIYRLTQRFQELIRAEIAETVERPEMIKTELDSLLEVLRR